jgi:hypothetical protein
MKELSASLSGISPWTSPTVQAPQAPTADMLVRAYFSAISQRDFAQLQSFLDPASFRYVSPTRVFNSATAYIADVARIETILKRIELRHMFREGDEVCVIYDFLSTLPELERVRVAAWFHIASGKIDQIEVFFDAHPYLSFFEDPGARVPP